MALNSLRFFSGLSFIAVFVLSACNETGKKETAVTGKDSTPVQAVVHSLNLDDHESYKKILREDSLNTDARLKLAAYFYLNKKFNEALYHYLIVNRIDKNNMAALYNLGNIYYDLQQNEDAIQYYEKFLALDKSNYNARCDLATCYLRLNKHEKAISILRENIKLNSNHLQSHYNLAVVLKESGKVAEAEAEMKIYNTLASQQPANTK